MATAVEVPQTIARPSRLRNVPRHAPFAAALLLICLLAAGGIGRGEFSYNGADESQHAATGLYFASLLHDLPLRHPVHYTFLYFAHYPAIGLIHWPPLFHFVEGAMFLAFGPSVLVARLTVLLFGVIGFAAWFRFVEPSLGQWGAAASTVLLAVLPAMLIFQRAVMLEVPALTLCILAAGFWTRYLLDERPRDAIWFGLLAAAALLTKLTSIYLALFGVLSLLFLRRTRLLRAYPTWLALGIVAALTGPYYRAVYSLHWKPMAPYISAGAPASVAERLALFPRALPGMLGWPVMILSMVGIVVSWREGDRVMTKVLLAWIAGCYVTFAAIGLREARYVLAWLPAFAYFAVVAGMAAYRTRWIACCARAGLVAILIALTARAALYRRPYVSGYREAAQRLTRRFSSGTILVDALEPGNLIFFLRAQDPGMRFVVLRKQLYVTPITSDTGSRNLVDSPQALLRMMERDGVRFVCVMTNAPYGFASQLILRDVLQSKQFRLLESVPIESNDRARAGQRLLLYENLGYRPSTETTLRIPMLTLGSDIVVSRDELGVR